MLFVVTCLIYYILSAVLALVLCCCRFLYVREEIQVAVFFLVMFGNLDEAE